MLRGPSGRSSRFGRGGGISAGAKSLVEGLPVGTCVLSGTCIGKTEADWVTGGLVTTLVTNRTLVADDGTFAAARAAVLAGFSSDSAEATDWIAEVAAKEPVASVVRTDDNTITITWTAAIGIDITATETVSFSLPASVVLLQSEAIVASPTFTVSAGEPFYGNDVSDSLLVNENWSGYDYLHSDSGTPALVGTSNGNTPYWEDNASNAVANKALEPTGGVAGGAALRFDYGVGAAYDHSLQIYNNGALSYDHFFFQQTFRTTVGWLPTDWAVDSGEWEGMKGWMFINTLAGNYRYQIGVTGLEGLSSYPSPTNVPRSPDWVCATAGVFLGRASDYDVSIGDTWDARYFCWEGRDRDTEPPPWGGKDGTGFPVLNDGNWHRFTYELKAMGSPQYERVWFDGILVWDNSAAGKSYHSVQTPRFFGNYSMGGSYFTTANPVAGSIWFDDTVMWERV